jgi:hypothetical protein
MLLAGVGGFAGTIILSELGKEAVRISLMPEPPPNNVNLQATVVLDGVNYYNVGYSWFTDTPRDAGFSWSIHCRQQPGKGRPVNGALSKRERC